MFAVPGFNGAPVSVEPVAGELVEPWVLLARVECEVVRRTPYAAADQRRDLVSPVGSAEVIPPLPLGAERDPEPLPIRADAESVGVLAVTLAVALDD